MTYLEKYKEEHPGLTASQYLNVVLNTCPHVKGLAINCPKDLRGPDCKMTNQQRCPICWEREIPGTEPANKTNNEREDGNMSNKFTKKDLKVGYVVKLRSGYLYMVTVGANGDVILIGATGSYTWLTYYKDDLTYHRGPNEDIVEVYGYCAFNYRSLLVDTEHRQLLWKREEKTCDNCAHKVVCTHVGTCEHYMEKEASK